MDQTRLKWSEAQTTLEELGIQLSVSKLQVSELQEKVLPGSAQSKSNTDLGGNWTPDSMSQNCKGCNREFNITRRKVSCKFYSNK